MVGSVGSCAGERCNDPRPTRESPWRIRGRPGELSSGFLFQIRERYAFLTNDPLTTPGRFGQLPEGMDASRILLAEYLRGRSRQGRADGAVQSEQAKETIKLLMKVCRVLSGKTESSTSMRKRWGWTERCWFGFWPAKHRRWSSEHSNHPADPD